METDLRDLAEQNGLQFIETTTEASGYPRNIRGAIIGFDTFEQAKELAEEHNLSIEVFEKKDGWQLWYASGSTAWEPFENSAGDFGDNYLEFDNSETEEHFFEEEVKPLFDDCHNFDDIEKLIERKKKVWEEIITLGDGEIVITYMGDYYKTIDKISMNFYEDTRYSAIGLIDRKL